MGHSSREVGVAGRSADRPVASTDPGRLRTHLAALRRFFRESGSGSGSDDESIESLVLETCMRGLAETLRPQALDEVQPFLLRIASEVLAERRTPGPDPLD